MLRNPQVQLGAVLWIAGMAGVVALSTTVLPQLLAHAPQPVPAGVAIAASLLQSAVLLALAVWAGVALSRPLGLGAPVIEAALAGSGAAEALKRQMLPAALGGLAVAGLLLYLTRAAPVDLQALGTRFHIPLAPKLLYGGITEELLMRWGLMSVLIWLPWRVLQRRNGPPRTAHIVGGVVAAAVLFGLGHLPAVVAMGVELSPPVVAYIVVGNTLPGIVFGVLYWRRGIEAAILAHALAHAVSSLALQSGGVV